MMTVTPTQCAANDLWMRERLAKAERYHQLTCTQPGAQRRASIRARMGRLLRRPIRVDQPTPVRQLQQAI